MKVKHIVAYSCISLIASHCVNKPQFLYSSVGGLGDKKIKDKGKKWEEQRRQQSEREQQGGENEERDRGIVSQRKKQKWLKWIEHR